MEATTPIATTPAPASTPAPTPAPAPAPTPAPAPIVQSVDSGGGSMMENGGQKSSGGGFFKSLNFVEIGFALLGATALYYAIYYYRYKVKQDKLINNELQRQIDELKLNAQTNSKVKYKTL